MDDVSAKISELLSDEESMKQISELAQMFMSDASENSESTDCDNSNSVNLFENFDFSKNYFSPSSRVHQCIL